MFTANPGRWLRYLVAVSAAIVLASCGGGDDDAETKNALIRVINATADIESIDLSREGRDDANDDDGEQRLGTAR